MKQETISTTRATVPRPIVITMYSIPPVEPNMVMPESTSARVAMLETMN